MERILELAAHGVSTDDVMRALGVSRATAHRRLQTLVRAGKLKREGAGRATRYVRAPRRWRFARAGLAEDVAWRKMEPTVRELGVTSSDELAAVHYAVSEMLNNAIDHSEARQVSAVVSVVDDALEITVSDDGVGVFERIKRAHGIAPEEDAVVQLEKGRLTSAPQQHTGEGIFFTSKVATRFRLASGRIAWIVDNEADDTAMTPLAPPVRGTRVTMAFVHDKVPRLAEVFARYTDPDTLRFDRTRTTVKLAAVGTRLMSRSEAKRVAHGLDKFTHVELDFEGVDIVGQGFVDEIFRVFAQAHPHVALVPVRANEAVAFMIARAVRR